MITKSRLEELEWYWEEETDDEETMKWRDELNAEEQALVEQWDYRKDFWDYLKDKLALESESREKEAENHVEE